MKKLLAIALLAVGAVFAAAVPALTARLEPQATILFVGDMMFDRYIRLVMERQGDEYVFSCINELLQRADTVVGNLEGPITPYPSISAGSEIGSPQNFTFTFAPAVAKLLAEHNIGIVSIGNNHSMNLGRDGLEHTKNYLSEAGVQYFGDPMSGESERVLRTSVNGVDFSFVNWSDWGSDKTDHTVAQVKKEVEAGRVVVVYAHWGEEYVPALPYMKVLARQFVDAGAVAVFGSHPHIVQESEVYNGAHIYYSLGNFVFDQYWNAQVREGLAVMATFAQDGVVSIAEHPVEMLRDGRTCPIVVL
jgi:poly-gamma-glutamate synthesis protein (capsule biosynthesis protein)